MSTTRSGSNSWPLAKMMKDITDVMSMGWLSTFVDPTGAMLCLWQTKR
jgi:predicted enzyme related to lactoylglutathione lyase